MALYIQYFKMSQLLAYPPTTATMVFRSVSSSPVSEALRSPAAPASNLPVRHKLNMADVGSLFIKMKRTARQPKSKSLPRVELDSGTNPITHPQIESSRSRQQQPISVTDSYVCHGGVNVKLLLRATRGLQLDVAEYAGANALAEETWRVVIVGPGRGRAEDIYKVKIYYTSLAVKCTVPDPHQPVELERAKNVHGLMTVIKRHSK